MSEEEFLGTAGGGDRRNRRHVAASARRSDAARLGGCGAVVPPLIFRKGLDLKHEVAGVLAESYHSDLIEAIKNADFQYASGRITIHLAREFGFCYGVDRAVDYAYQARRRFPDRTVYLTGEIIHNPHVNAELRAQGIRFLTRSGRIPRPAHAGRRRHPAGVRRDDRAARRSSATRVHSRRHHLRLGAERVEERQAIRRRRVHLDHSRQVLARGDARHRVAGAPCRRRPLSHRARPRRSRRSSATTFAPAESRPTFLARFERATSPGFDPDRDLQRIGCANQTTMLSSESLEVGEMLRAGDAQIATARQALPERFRAFDTICSATQDRQDAVKALLDEHPVDLMVVIGGLNSSNTCNLARICAQQVPTYHIADPEGLVSAD